MTSATTVLGLLPLVLFSKAEESIWYALSLATIGGLLGSTLLVLVAIPVLVVMVGERTSRNRDDAYFNLFLPVST